MMRNICAMPSCTSPSEPPLGGQGLAETQLAGRRYLQAHLVLDVGGVDAVALPQLAGLPVGQELRDHEQRQPLGAGAASAGNALGTGEHEVDDVLLEVVLTAGDEPLDALDVPRAVRLRQRPGPPGPDVGSGVGLGEHHGRGPVLVGPGLGPALLLVGAEAPEHMGERRARGVDVHGRVGAEDHLGHRPAQGRRERLAADLGGQVEVLPAAVAVGLVRPPERVGDRDALRLRVVDRRSAVGLEQGVRQLVGGEALDLGQDAAGGVLVEVGVRGLAEHGLSLEDLEQHELDVPQVGLVVPHHVLLGAKSTRR